MAGIEITRLDMTATELRGASARTTDARAARRMLALALVLEGSDRKSAATSCGMDRQTLRDRVHRHNAEGLAGLDNRKAPGARRLLSPAQQVELAQLVEAGPDPERDGVVRWRRSDLKRKLADSFGVAMPERTLGKQLARLGLVRLTARVRSTPRPMRLRQQRSNRRMRKGNPARTWLGRLASAAREECGGGHGAPVGRRASATRGPQTETGPRRGGADRLHLLQDQAAGFAGIGGPGGACRFVWGGVPPVVLISP